MNAVSELQYAATHIKAANICLAVIEKRIAKIRLMTEEAFGSSRGEPVENKLNEVCNALCELSVDFICGGDIETLGYFGSSRFNMDLALSYVNDESLPDLSGYTEEQLLGILRQWRQQDKEQFSALLSDSAT